MKVYVYAICKNEETFVDRWVDSMREADGICVLDTGSGDGTVEKLARRGVTVRQEIISPWRFDEARNRSLALVPEDGEICVCTDLDEVFRPGWRAALEAAWTEGTDQAAYRYTWSFRPDGAEDTVFWAEKIHARRGWRWAHPVHEVLERLPGLPPARKVAAAGVQLDHHPDPSKSRGQYLPLLELSVAEDPADDRNTHYLGREYLYYGRWDDCIRTLKRHLALPSARWADERCASMRYIARAYRQKGEAGEARRWLWRAVGEAPHLREPWLELAWQLYEAGEWDGVAYLCRAALALEDRPQTYVCEGWAWGSLPWDLLSLALYHTGRREEALAAVRRALALEPENERFRQNEALLAGNSVLDTGNIS